MSLSLSLHNKVLNILLLVCLLLAYHVLSLDTMMSDVSEELGSEYNILDHLLLTKVIVHSY